MIAVSAPPSACRRNLRARNKRSDDGSPLSRSPRCPTMRLVSGRGKQERWFAGTHEREKAARRSPEVRGGNRDGFADRRWPQEWRRRRGVQSTQAGLDRHRLWSGATLDSWVSSAATAQQLVDRVARDGWDTFSARIAMRRQMVAADGAAVGPAATTTEYTWERTRTARGWKTTMTMVAAPRVRVQARRWSAVTLPEAPTVVKTEDLGDGSAPRFWDLNGVEIKMPSAAVQAHVMGPDATAVGASMAEGILAGAAWGQGGAGRRVSRLDRRDHHAGCEAQAASERIRAAVRAATRGGQRIEPASAPAG